MEMISNRQVGQYDMNYFNLSYNKHTIHKYYLNNTLNYILNLRFIPEQYVCDVIIHHHGNRDME